MLRDIICISLLVMLFPHPGQCASKDDYYDLYEYLFKADSYNKEIRPAESETSNLEVHMLFSLLTLDSVDEKQQTMVTTARLEFLWDDDFLSWNSTEFGEITSLLVPQKNIYLPDIVVANSGIAQEQLGYDELQVRIYYNGQIEWSPTLLLSTSCDLDITYFPFDTQKCYIEFITAVSKTYEIIVYVNTARTSFFLGDYSENGQWELIDHNAEDLEPVDEHSKLRFGVVLKRRRTFYMLNIILPIFFLSLCASLVFALPADEGEKMSTGITVLLAFAVYLTILSELVPNTSLQVSILGLYLTVLLGLSALSIIVCVFILRLHFREADRPVGPKTSSIIHFLRKMMCLGSKEDIVRNRVSSENREETETTHEERDARISSGFSIQFVDPKNQLTWQNVAYTLDLFCFILFTFLTILFTLLCLLLMDIGATTNGPTL